MATTFDYIDTTTRDNYYYGGSMSAAYTPRHFVICRRVSLVDAHEDLYANTVFGASDILQLINVEEGKKIVDAAIEVNTAEGAALTATLGDETDTNGYLVDVDFDTATWYDNDGTYGGAYINASATGLVGKLYSSADTVDILFNTAGADAAVFDVYLNGVWYKHF